MEITGIIHAHSSYSYDAKLSLREIRELCIQKGIQFVCMTEHTDELTKERAENFVRECDSLSDADFLFIPGFEVPYRSAHVLMIGMRAFLGVYAPTLLELRPWALGASFVVLAHPVRNAFAVEEGLLELLHGLEVWNQQYEGKRVPRIRSLALFGALKEKKESLIATGGVDFHRREHFGGPLITLDVASFAEGSILEKLCSGAFTVSSDRAFFFGSLPDPTALIRKHRFESHFSVSIITVGKLVNKICATLGFSLPRSFREFIRKQL